MNLVEQRDEPDLDDTRFGWCRVGSLWLAGRPGGGGEPRRVEDVLLLALHSTEDGPPVSGDIELEFFVEEVAPGYSVIAPLSSFLEIWLPRITRDQRPIVLALCNPQRQLIARPEAAGTAPLHFGLGDVDSWRDDVALGPPELRLVADEWRTV